MSKITPFDIFFKEAVVVKHNDYNYEVTDGTMSIAVVVESYGFYIEHSMVELTKEQAELVFDYVHSFILDNVDDDYDVMDEQGIFGYGY